MLNVISGVHGTPTPPATNSYESIATVDVGAGLSATVTFSSIPSTFKHLQIRAIQRNGNAGTGNSAMVMQFNSDSGANYARHALYGNGATAAASGNSSQNWFVAGASPDSGNGTSVFGVSVIDVLDYQNTNKYKTTRALMGYDANGSGAIELRSGLWMNTDAISTITLTINGGASFQNYSSFALYGIKG